MYLGLWFYSTRLDNSGHKLKTKFVGFFVAS